MYAVKSIGSSVNSSQCAFYLSKKLLKLIICDWNTEGFKSSSKFTLSDGVCLRCIKSLESLVIKKQNITLDNAKDSGLMVSQLRITISFPLYSRYHWGVGGLRISSDGDDLKPGSEVKLFMSQTQSN